MRIWKNLRMTTAATTPLRTKMEMMMVTEMRMERMGTGVSQSHYFQTEQTSLHRALGRLQRTMKSRVGMTSMTATGVGKTSRSRKMSEETTKSKNHKRKCLSRVNFQQNELWISIYNVSCVELLPYFIYFFLRLM